MKNYFGTIWPGLLDVHPDPLHPVSWGALLVLLAIVFLLAVTFAAGLVFLLIRIKRRKANSA